MARRPLSRNAGYQEIRVYSPLENVGYQLPTITTDPFQVPADITESPFDSRRDDEAPLIDGVFPNTVSPPHSKDQDDIGGDGGYPSSQADGADLEHSRTFSSDSSKTLKRKPVSGTQSLQSLRDFHKSIDDPNHPHAKLYDFRRTRDKLFIRCFTQWFITIILAGAIAGLLGGYSKRDAIGPSQKHVFNALVTGFLIALGINLASSLRSYADLLRWRLLASSWFSLRQFDLVLSCSSQFKILELLFESCQPRFPFLSMIQVLCLVWLFINIATQALVAMIGLTYSLDQSPNDIIVPGNVSIANMTAIVDLNSYLLTNEPQAERFQAQAYGIQGQDYYWQTVDDPYDWYAFETTYSPQNGSYVLYRFVDSNPNNLTNVKSNRTVTSAAVCNVYDVLKNEPYIFNSTPYPGNLLTYFDGDQNQTLYVQDWAPGAITYISDTRENFCGPRCGHVLAFQAAQSKTSPNEQVGVYQDTLYDCNNTVSEVSNATLATLPYLIANPQARYFAGAIGWTGIDTFVGNNASEFYQYRLYSTSSYWSPSYTLDQSGPYSAASLISQFTEGAIAAMDANSLRVVVEDGLQPQSALMVTVEWKNVAVLLAAIVGIQFAGLTLVIAVANKAVIKDDSPLAIAKLFTPILSKMGAHGTVLRGHELADYFGDTRKIFYGCRELQSEHGHDVFRAEIMEMGEGQNPRFKRPFRDGKYV